MRKFRLAFTCACICSLAIVSLGNAVLAAVPPSVTIDNFTVKPAGITVRAGTAVTFTNGDDIPHSIIASDGAFHSKALDTGDAFTFTFKTPGDFPYFCGLHPHMQGHVIVTP